MTKRTFLIIVSAVLLALFVAFVWFLFFRGGTPAPTTGGEFGTGGNRPAQTGTGNTGVSGNVPSSVINQGVPGSGTTGSTIQGGTTVVGGETGSVGASGTGGVAAVPGVDWLGSGSVPGGGPVSNFVPRTVNELNQGNVSGSPTILPGNSLDPNNNNDFLGTALLGAGIGAALCTAGFSTGALAGGALGIANSVTAVPVADKVTNAGVTDTAIRENFLNCLTRTIARIALQQITASVVNWINSGFNGQPSFVTNYRQFFTNVADQAAGEFIRGAGLSFLCSPFQNQIRIAIAQSYARRNAQSCTISGVIRNLNSFANGGQFSQGGWRGLLSFTNTPTNNPFGAYTYGQGELMRVQTGAVAQRQQDYVIGRGFLSSEKCDTVVVNGATQKRNCRIVTPGSTIAESLNKQLGVGQDSLNMAKNFDEIINALITQLMVRALQGGLSSLSGTQGYASNFLTPEQQQAQAEAQAILTDMQGRVNVAQQYGSVWQGAIADIQNAQQQLQAVVNCWETASSSEEGSRRDTAITNAKNAAAARDFYNAQVDAYNAKITQANESITLLQNLQTRAIGVTSAGDVASVKAAHNQALASGAIISQADVVSAQQDRATLQTALSARNAQTSSELQQCNAF